MRFLLGALAILTAVAPSAAAAPAPGAPEAPPRHPTFDEASYGQLGVTHVYALAHPVLGIHDLYCPRTSHPSPFVVIVLDPEQPRAEGEGQARALARYGFGALVLDPKQAGADLLAAAIEALLANTATEHSEPGCHADGRVAALGILRGGLVALSVAREREAAGRPLAAAAMVLGGSGALAAPATTPTLFVEASRVPRAGGTLIAIEQAAPCDVRPPDHPCWKQFLPNQDRERSAAVRRQLALGDAVIVFLRATLEQDDRARTRLDNFLHPPPPARPEPEDRRDPAEYGPLFHLGGIAGGAFNRSASLALAFRPEILFARVREGHFGSTTSAFGLGIYGEAARIGGVGSLGAGVTFAAISGRLGIAPSFGVIRSGGSRGMAGSLFLGFRDAEDLPPLDLATGIRFEVRQIDEQTTVLVSAQLDLMLPLLAIYALASLGDTIGGKR